MDSDVCPCDYGWTSEWAGRPGFLMFEVNNCPAACTGFLHPALCQALCWAHGKQNDQDLTSDPVWFSDLGRAGKNTAQSGITETLLEDGENHRTSRPRMDKWQSGRAQAGHEMPILGLLGPPFLLPLPLAAVGRFPPSRLEASDGQRPYPLLPLISLDSLIQPYKPHLHFRKI